MSADSGISTSETKNTDHNTSTSDKNNYSVRPTSFNGDDEQFSWWKIKMYSHIIGVDDKLWDLIEDGDSFEVDTEGIVTDRKSLTPAQRKIYMKHHRVRGILVGALPHA